MVIEAVRLIMTNNVFQFDDTFWLQKTGCAMGTNVACTYATIYFSYHEETELLSDAPPTLPFSLQPALLLHCRLIDDAFQIWDFAKLPADLSPFNFTQQMKEMMKFGILQWDVDPPSKEVNFLDLTIRLEADGTTTTKTFVKPMNLHLYIPAHSAHNKGVLKSLIFGNMLRYWIQNSHFVSFAAIANDFFNHLLDRGYTVDTLAPIFEEVANTLDHESRSEMLQRLANRDTLVQPPKESRLFLHWEQHPRGIPRKLIRQLFNTHLAPVLSQTPLNIRQFTIAYRNPPNLRRLLTKTQLNEAPATKASLLLGRLEQNQPAPDPPE